MAAGVEYHPYYSSQENMYRIRASDGSELPEMLRTACITKSDAHKYIEKYFRWLRTELENGTSKASKAVQHTRKGANNRSSGSVLS